jgi:hypothetical protein
MGGFLVLLTVVALFLVPALSSSRVESIITTRLENRGIKVTSLKANLRGDGQVAMDELCINDVEPFADQRLACFRGVNVNVALIDALRGRPRVEKIDTEEIEFWLPRERGTLDESITRLLSVVRGTEEKEADDDIEETVEESAINNLDLIVIDSVIGHLEGHPAIDGTQRVETIRLERTGGRANFSANFKPELSTDSFSSVDSNLSELAGLELTATASIDDRSLQSASLTASSGSIWIESAASGLPPARIELSGLDFEAPYAVSIRDLSAAAGELVSFSSPRATVEPGKWTTNLEEFFIANLTFETPTLELSKPGAIREFVSQAKAASSTETRQEASEAEEHAGTDGEGEEQVEEPSLVERALRAIDGRKWWEVLPRQVMVEDGTVRLASTDHRPSIEMTRIEFTYGMRYIRFQMDAEASARLYVGAEDSGQVGLKGRWNYQENSLTADLTIEELEFGTLADALLASSALDLSGTINSELHAEGDTEDGFSYELSVNADNPYVAADILAGPYEITSVSMKSSGRVEEEEDSWKSTLNIDELAVEDAIFGGGLTLNNLGFDGLVAEQIDVHVEVPDQPAMTLFDIVPEPVIGPLAGTEMTGEFGLTLKFPIHLQREEDSADVAFDIGHPTTYDFRDGNLGLAHLPEEVDVRRLNSGMRFMFRGPNDSVMRRMEIPPPSMMRDYPGISEVSETPMGWTRLPDISFYLIAAQLYREDGSFFTNSGINWFQLRRVTAEAIEERELGRGASTITMQLVKNVFLTHDRSVERKLRELFLSYWTTRIVPKERILEVYLNIIEWGPELNGITEAADFYLQKKPSELGVVEATWLSSITPDPVDLGGDGPKRGLTAQTCTRCRWLIEGLSERGWLSNLETDIAMENPSDAGSRPSFLDSSPFSGSSPRSPNPGESGTPGEDGFAPVLPAQGNNAQIREAPSDFQLMSPSERLREWVDKSPRPRGATPE